MRGFWTSLIILMLTFILGLAIEVFKDMIVELSVAANYETSQLRPPTKASIAANLKKRPSMYLGVVGL
jgi:hypothetical protein